MRMKMCWEIRQKLLFILMFVRGFNCLYDEGPSFEEEPGSRVEFINELGVRLNCSVRGRPAPSIRWTWADGSGLVEVPGLRYFSTSDGSLVFPPFAAEAFRPDVHSATYKCIASNSVGTIVSRDVQLRAVVKEDFEVRVETQRGTRGFPTLMDCVINPKYMKDYIYVTSWVRDKSYNILPGSLLEPDSSSNNNKYEILSDGKLLLWQLGAQDALSTYQCRVLHRLTGQTKVSTPGKLYINEIDGPSRPEIQLRTGNIISKESERVILPCIATGLPKPSYRWFRKEGSRLIPVIDETVLDERLWESHGSSSSSSSSSSSMNFQSSTTTTTGLIRIRHGALIISSVKVAHKGVYLCNASSSLGSDFQEIDLIVRSPLVVSLHPEKLTVDLGKNAEFSCSASGEPQPGSVVWLKDGTALRSGSGAGRVRFLSQNRIGISGVVREDQGIYQCVVKNDYETAQQAAQLRLGDAYPQFIYRFIEQTLQAGPAISLKCSATGNPTPKVSWLLDGFPLPQSDRFLIGQYANVYGDVISHVNITSVRVEDGGEYECSFENRAGKTSHAARLNIYGQPYVRPMPDILATAGLRLIVKCPVGGYPVDSIVWERAGQKLPVSDRQSVSLNGTLSIEPVERSDGGAYACLAVNKQGTISQRSVNVRVMVPPKITPFTFATDLHEGERASIQCVVVKGDLPLTITWLKDSVPLLNNNNNIGGSSIGHIHGHGNHLHKSSPLTMITHDNNNDNTNSPQQQQQLLQLLLQNKAHGNSATVEAKLSIRQLDHFSSVLSIASLEAGHSGNYTCQARNSAATAMHTSALRVNVPPRISPFSFDEGLTEGMRTQVMCTTIAGDEPINMTWLKDTRPVLRPLSHGQPQLSSSQANFLQQLSSKSGGPAATVESGIHVNYFSPFSTILTIPNITATHSGNYSCIVSNLVGQVVHTAQLVVTVPAKWVVEPGDQSVSVGSHVAIHCQARGFPKPNIKWKQAVGGLEKKEFREVGYRTPGVLAAENGSLIISRVTEDHEAHYLCQANNGVGPGLSKLIRLTVNASPRIRSRPPKEMVRRGETVRLRCEAEGDEPIRISWVAKGISLNDTRDSRYSTIGTPGSGPGSSSMSELSIRDVAIEDRGDFECIAVNAFGQDSLRVSLLVQERPQVPNNFRLAEQSSRTAVVSWSLSPSSDQDANVLDYIVWYKEHSENWSEQTNKKSTSGDQNTLTISGLLPAVTYNLRLYARNQLGMSDPSTEIEVTTEGEPPGGPPVHLTVEAVSSTELRISWQPPLKEYRHGQILGYNLGMKKARDETEKLNWTRVDHTRESSLSPVVSLTVRGLEKSVEYEVSISAFNERGQGPASQPIVTSTLEDVPGGSPGDVGCSSPTAHSLAVSWQPPAKKVSNGVILSYRVVLESGFTDDMGENNEYAFYGNTNSGAGVGTELESRVTTLATAFHGLQPFTNFSIQVAASTAVGDGVLSQPIYCQTLESVPDPPSSVKAVASSPDSFIVSWQGSKVLKGRLQKYHLYMRISDSVSGREIRTVKRTVGPSTWNYEVSETKRRETYEVWITAETQVGEGAQSPSVNYLSTSTVPAATVSFGRFIASPWKTEVVLPCLAVGVPKPIVNWKRRETKNIDPSGSPKYDIGSGKDNVLRIKNAQRVDSGNYSCFVRNPTGSDHIVYSLQVQVPPTAPLLHPTAITSSGVRLQWKQGDNGGSQIRGFILNFRPSDGEWEEITLSRKLSTYQVESLRCGHPYEFFLSALNKIGGGLPSETVRVTTKGTRPVVPSGFEVLQPRPNGVTISLAPWDTPDCPVNLFLIEYKAKTGGTSSWNTVRHELGQGISLDDKVIEINELTPETDYVIRIRGVNGAGTSTAEYEISTSVFKGGFGGSSSRSSKFNLTGDGRGGGPSSRSSSSSSGGGLGGNDNDHGDTGNGPFYQDLHIMLPLILSAFAIISAAASLILWLRRRKISEGLVESTNSLAFRRDPLESRGRTDYIPDRDYTVIRGKIMADCDYIPESADDIYPYATFHLGEKETLSESIPEGYYSGGGPPSSQRLSNTETIPIRQLSRGLGHTHHQQQQQQQQHMRNSRPSNSNSNNMIPPGGLARTGDAVMTGGGESTAGESDEYDDSCGSDSEALGLGLESNLVDNNSTINRVKLSAQGGLYSGGNSTMVNCPSSRGSTLFRNDETLLVTDRKSLPRGTRSKFLYGYSSNHGRITGPGGYLITTTDRRGNNLVVQEDNSNSTATTSFIFSPPQASLGQLQHNTSHNIMELSQIPLVECDNRISTGRNNSILGTRFMTNPAPKQLPTLGNPINSLSISSGSGCGVGFSPSKSKLGGNSFSINNSSGRGGVPGGGNNKILTTQQHQLKQSHQGNVHSDYTIAV